MKNDNFEMLLKLRITKANMNDMERIIQELLINNAIDLEDYSVASTAVECMKALNEDSDDSDGISLFRN